jgi:hypothetical protein
MAKARPHVVNVNHRNNPGDIVDTSVLMYMGCTASCQLRVNRTRGPKLWAVVARGEPESSSVASQHALIRSSLLATPVMLTRSLQEAGCGAISG